MRLADYKISAVFFLLLIVVSVAGAGTLHFFTSPDSSSSSSLDSRNATVIEIVDADTLEVEFENGETDTVRLLGVDSPEINAENQPDEFEGVPATSEGLNCLREWGFKAKKYAEFRLLGAEIEVITDSEAEKRGDYDRLLAYVRVKNASLEPNYNLALLKLGYARIYDTEFSKRDEFAEMEKRARNASRGLWKCRS